MMTREPAVAGSFYPADRAELADAVRAACAGADGARGASRCVVSPHAGYVYSARIACMALSALREPQNVIIIGPDHAGAGSSAATSGARAWRTPLGDARIGAEASAHLEAGARIGADDVVHAREHSIEVQVPILQHMAGGELRIVPVAITDQGERAAVALGRAAARTAGEHGCSIVASSDLTHYEPDGAAREKDAALLEPVCALDVRGFYSVLRERRVSACGYGAIAAAMAAASELGASRGRLLGYATSGEIADASSVVGYAAVAFE